MTETLNDSRILSHLLKGRQTLVALSTDLNMGAMDMLKLLQRLAERKLVFCEKVDKTVYWDLVDAADLDDSVAQAAHDDAPVVAATPESSTMPGVRNAIEKVAARLGSRKRPAPIIVRPSVFVTELRVSILNVTDVLIENVDPRDGTGDGVCVPFADVPALIEALKAATA